MLYYASMKKNAILIGMPGVGKSTAGVVLAKLAGYRFLDSDLLIQQEDGRLLREIIAQEGNAGFHRIEERINAAIDVDRTVIATGGSVIYGPAAMAHFKEIGTVIYLRASYETVASRVTNLVGRGVTMNQGQTLKDLYDERKGLYERYCDVAIDVDRQSIEETALMMARIIRGD